jgi:sec-independent protein translocase protein TatB
MAIAPTIQAANIGMADTLILMVMALVVFGPRRLPQIGRQIGKLMYEFRKASNDFKFQMEEELRNAEESDRRKKEEEERQRQLAANPPAQIEASASATTETTTPAEAPTEFVDSRDPYAYGYGELTEESLRIQPPSTGEMVPADPPTAGVAATEEPAAPVTTEAAGETASAQATLDFAGETNSSAVEGTEKAIESATHNG